jgi:hypothetical protein
MIIIIFNLLYFIVFLLLSCFVLVYWFGLHWFFSLILIVFEVIVLCLINTNKYKTTLFPSQINNKINVKEKGGVRYLRLYTHKEAPAKGNILHICPTLSHPLPSPLPIHLPA